MFADSGTLEKSLHFPSNTNSLVQNFPVTVGKTKTLTYKDIIRSFFSPIPWVWPKDLVSRCFAKAVLSPLPPVGQNINEA